MTEGPHGFTQADLDRLRLIQAADLSPDGTLAVFSQFTTDPGTEQDHCALRLVEVPSGATRPLTAGTGKDTFPAFSPDGGRVAFVSDRTGKAQIHLIPIDGGEASQVTDLAEGVAGAPVWSPDGTRLAFAAGPQRPPRDRSRPYRITRSIYRFDGMGYLDDVKQDLYVVPAAGGEATRLTTDENLNNAPSWAPDGRGLVYLSGFGPTSLNPWLRARYVDLDGNSRDLPHPEGGLTAAAFAPDGRLALEIHYRAGNPIGAKSELYVSNAALDAFECRTTSLQGQVGAGFQGDLPVYPPLPRIRFLADGRALTRVQVGTSAPLFAIALSGPEAFEQLTPGANECVAHAAAGGRVLYGVSDFGEPGDLFVLENGTSTRLTELNKDVLAGLLLPEVIEVPATSVDGARVDGFFLKPRTGSAPYPTILYIHGGPHSAFGHDFHADMNLLVGAGYGVVTANHRASTGYGDEFSTKITGDWGNLDYADLMAVVDAAVERGLADPDRLGVCGLSGGGNLTSWIVGHTDRFKAAVPENPVTSFLSMFGVQDIGLWFGAAETGTTPSEGIETYLKMSPLTYAHRCTTPTLLVQGENDMRCPPEQSEQFYAALTLAGCPVEMLRLPGVPHIGAITGPYPIRAAQNAALVEWMNRWILGTPAPEVPAGSEALAAK